MKLSYNEISLIRHCLNFTGEKELGQDGKTEVNSARRLKDPVEISQRRHFTKNTDKILEDCMNEQSKIQEDLNKILEDHKKPLRKKTPKKDDEKDEDYERKIFVMIMADAEMKKIVREKSDEIKKISDESHEIEVTGETKKVLKKYVDEFGEQNGFMPNDDETIESLNVKLKD